MQTVRMHKLVLCSLRLEPNTSQRLCCTRHSVTHAMLCWPCHPRELDVGETFDRDNGKATNRRARVLLKSNPVQVKRRGAVRQAKLYYLRDLEGKKARIKEDLNYGKKHA